MGKGTIIVVIIAIVIASGVTYAISPYFTESTINEEFPVLKGSEMGNQMEKTVDNLQDTMEEMNQVIVNNENLRESEDMMEIMGDLEDSIVSMNEMVDDMMGVEPEMDMMEEMMATEEMMDENSIALEYEGMFVGVGDGVHDAEGSASVYTVGDQTVLRLEDFAATNGPALKVYLATDKTASDYVSLGALKANRGNQNYDIEAGVDLSMYDTVLIWCEPFRVLFGSADIAPVS